jgi:hypothetical protein
LFSQFFANTENTIKHTVFLDTISIQQLYLYSIVSIISKLNGIPILNTSGLFTLIDLILKSLKTLSIPITQLILKTKKEPLISNLFSETMKDLVNLKKTKKKTKNEAEIKPKSGKKNKNQLS